MRKKCAGKFRPTCGETRSRRFRRVRRRGRKCRCSGAPATYQRSLHYILAHYPITASSIQFCLLCCQPEPIPRLLNCQGITACAMKTLQTTCLIGVSHRHAMQDLVSSGTLHHPDLKETIGDLTLPATGSTIAVRRQCLQIWERTSDFNAAKTLGLASVGYLGPCCTAQKQGFDCEGV